MIAAVAIIVMFAIYFSSLGGSTDKSEDAETYDYCAAIASELKAAVCKLNADGEARVAIGWKSGVEDVIAYTKTESANGTTVTPTIINGSGGSGAIVLKRIYPEASGVIIVTKNGGSNVKLRLQLKEMAATLLGISPDKVAVYDRK